VKIGSSSLIDGNACTEYWNRQFSTLHFTNRPEALTLPTLTQGGAGIFAIRKARLELIRVTHKIHHSVRSEKDIQGGRRILLDFRWGGEELPALLLMPSGRTRAPAALLLHGLNLDKEKMSDMAGQALLRQGIASLTLDLPLHGERSRGTGTATDTNPFDMMRRWRGAQEECLVALRYMARHPALDGARLGLVGYSLGAFLGLRVAAESPAVKALVIAGGGDLPDYTPFISVARAFSDPLKQVRQLGGRPLFMLHGKYDKAVPPKQAERLFQAAREPKKLVWWDCGHVLPPDAIDSAASWLAEQFKPPAAPTFSPEEIRRYTL